MDLEQSFHPYMLAFCITAALLLVGTFLRAVVPLFQRFLIPAALIGGILGFSLMASGWLDISEDTFAIMFYHLFNLGAISIALTDNSGNAKGAGKKVFKGAVKVALMWTAILAVQSLIGAGVIWGWNGVNGSDYYEGLGFLSGIGFAQGGGQALSIGIIWESEFNIANAISLGLTFSAIGYFISFLAGVPIVNWGVRKGLTKTAPTKLPKEIITGIYDKDNQPETGKQSTHPASVDAFAFHMAAILALYGLCYIIVQLLQPILPPTLAKMAFAFIFLIGLIVALFTKILLRKLGLSYLINPDTQTRISGTLIDFLFIPTMMAIQISVVWEFIVPILAITLLSLGFTLAFVFYFRKKMPLDFDFERAIAVYGGTTGTVATSFILLKMMDPNFKTPIAMELVLYNFIAIATTIHIILLLGVAPGPNSISLLGMIIMYIVTAGIMTGLIFVFHRFWKN